MTGGGTKPWAIADALYGLLRARVEELEGSPDGSHEHRERAALTAAIECYERVRWPDGNAPRHKRDS